MEPITKDSIYEAIQYHDVHLAVLTLNWAAKHPEFVVSDTEMIQLKYVRINSLPVIKLLQLMKQSILTAYTIPDLLLSDAIEEYIVELDNVNEEIELYKNLLTIIESHQELLGTADIIVAGIKVKPTIANWFKDYSVISNIENKTALDEAQYITTSSNVRLLEEHERAVLRDVFNLYDDCKEKLYEWETTPSAKDDQEADKLLQGYDLYETFPELEDDLNSEYSVQTGSLDITSEDNNRKNEIISKISDKSLMDLPLGSKMDQHLTASQLILDQDEIKNSPLGDKTIEQVPFKEGINPALPESTPADFAVEDIEPFTRPNSQQYIPKPPIEIKPVEIAKPQLPVTPPKPKPPVEVRPPQVPEKPKPVTEFKAVIPQPKPVITPPKQKEIDEQPFQIGGHIDPKQQAKRGVIYDQDTNIDLGEIEDKAKLEAKRQHDIVLKLEELKKRKNKI